MELNKTNKYNFLILIVCILGIIFLIFLKNDKVNEMFGKDEYTVINNPSNFFTLEGCANKYISSLYNGETEEILTLLNKEYKIKYNINEHNIYNYISFFQNNTSFNAKKIYVKDETIFYIWGYLIEETIDSFNLLDNYFLIININDDNTFDITPYDGQIFIDKGDINER